MPSAVDVLVGLSDPLLGVQLAVRVDPALWEDAAARLVGGLAAVDPFDAGSPWVRIGYWVVAVATVGVATELARQAVRAKRPEHDPDELPALAVTR